MPFWDAAIDAENKIGRYKVRRGRHIELVHFNGIHLSISSFFSNPFALFLLYGLASSWQLVAIPSFLPLLLPHSLLRAVITLAGVTRCQVLS